ncbi:MAG: large conductance mechanosensitive channel protein MscL [Clostridiales bacterium]|nr:large conductance mechanosensitive channel protein MscL [Clostridiales bacterium]
MMHRKDCAILTVITNIEEELLMKKFLADFKKFALRGNVLDMAVGVIIGGAFTGIVTSLTTNFITPLLNKVMTGHAGGLDEAGAPIVWSLGEAGSAFLTTVVNFIITALVLFCLITLINKLMSIGKKPEAPAAPTTKKCPYCCSEIAIEATRCPHCTSELN